MNPLHPWLCRLESKTDIKITSQYGDDYYVYTGTIIVVEKELCLFKERNTFFLIRINDIVDISGEKELFDVVHTRKKGANPFWRWLKHFEKSEDEVEIVTCINNQNFKYGGNLIKVETNLCLIENRRTRLLFRIDDIVEISGQDTLFNLKANVKIEEFDDMEN